MPSRALYLCYFGLREPLVQTQVLPYLRELAAGGVAMSLLTFEREPFDAGPWREALQGIEWHALRYHKSTWLKPYDIVRGAWKAAAMAPDVFHGRSHAGTAMGAIAKLLRGGKLIFDIRGFLADEYADSGNWRTHGTLYRLAKRVERWLYRAADGFVVLTEAARGEVSSREKPLEVIPCCIDPARFAGDERVDLPAHPVFIYCGTLGGYYLGDEMRALAARAGAHPLILSQRSVAPKDVPKYLRAADVAMLLVRPSYARRAMSPAKFAEYLAAGLPVIATKGIGDLDAQITGERLGVLLDGDDYDAALRAMAELRRDPKLAERCREFARTHYDLHSVGGVRYRRLYDAVLRA
jgi:glycosyltransferase involved in cell wall biosynthesis